MSLFDDFSYQWTKGEKNWHTKYNNALTALKTFLGDKLSNTSLASWFSVEHNADGTHTASASTPVDFKASGHTPVYVSLSSFRIAGIDLTSTYVVGRRLKITLSGGDAYCTVKTVAFSTDTTITTEETTITNTISAVAYGIVSPGSTGSFPKHDHSSDAQGGSLGSIISGATSKSTPVDADSLALSDSAASNSLKKLTWANLKATAKAYFDSLYATIAEATSAVAITGGAIDGTPVGASTPSSGVFTALKAWGVESPIWGGTSGGSANAQTLTPSPAVAALATGQKFWFIAGYTSTSTSPTINPSGLGAKTITREGAVALMLGDIVAGGFYVVMYDGTRMILLNPSSQRTKVISATRSAGAGNGTVSYTGVGFQPSHVILIACRSDSSAKGFSIGFDNGSTPMHINEDSAGNYSAMTNSRSLRYEGSYSANVTTLDSDGFTLNWNQDGGAVSGTITFIALCLK